MLTSKTEIKKWLNMKGISKYNIRHDLTVDVDGSVVIEKLNTNYLPVQFGKVFGNFIIDNLSLTSLKGCPLYVSDSFFCSGNPLINLEHAPLKVGINFYCNDMELENLYGISKTHVEGYFNVRDTPINNLDYLPASASKIRISHEEIKVPGLEEFYIEHRGNFLLEMPFEELKIIYLERKLNSKLEDKNKIIKKLKV